MAVVLQASGPEVYRPDRTGGWPPGGVEVNFR
jgi:hypothetical protein